MAEILSDLDYLKMAVVNSRQSMEDGNFPAGAILVKDGEILASEISSKYPGLLHADSKAVTHGFEKTGGLLEGATLYCSMQSCLMCTSVAYWGGIRRIVYAVRKSEVDQNYYESPGDTAPLIASFNQKMEIVHMPQLEEETLGIVREWELTPPPG